MDEVEIAGCLELRLGRHKLGADILHEEDYCWRRPTRSGKSTDSGRWGPMAGTENMENSCHNYCMTLLAWSRQALEL